MQQDQEQEELRDCHDCGARPGEPHRSGCDVERCNQCGRQAISCGHTEPQESIWTGIWPGVMECREFGWYSIRNPNGPGYIPCSPDTPGAGEDLNRLYRDAVWDKVLLRYVLPKPAPRPEFGL